MTQTTASMALNTALGQHCTGAFSSCVTLQAAPCIQALKWCPLFEYWEALTTDGWFARLVQHPKFAVPSTLTWSCCVNGTGLQQELLGMLHHSRRCLDCAVRMFASSFSVFNNTQLPIYASTTKIELWHCKVWKCSVTWQLATYVPSSWNYEGSMGYI